MPKPERVIAEHEAIVEAIRQQDSDETSHKMRLHLANVRGKLKRYNKKKKLTLILDYMGSIMTYDVIIIGAGLVGLGVASALQESANLMSLKYW